MCLRTPPPPSNVECDCYECVEARRGRSQGQGPEEGCSSEAPASSDVLGMWQDAFHEAYHEVQLEIFKAKIKATMSKSMEKTAALVLEAMTAEMHENIRRARFQKDLRTKIEKLIESAAE